MNLLQHDIDELNERFPEAMSFIRGALLRKEAVELLYQQTHKTPLSPWQETRLNELLSLHACQQPLFLKIKENQSLGCRRRILVSASGKKINKKINAYKFFKKATTHLFLVYLE